MPGKHEQQNENKSTSTDEDLDETQDEHEPIEKTFLREPVGDNADDREWLEDGEGQVHDVGIVELVMIRQPAARDKMPIDRGRGDHVNDRNQRGSPQRRHQRRFFRLFHGAV